MWQFIIGVFIGAGSALLLYAIILAGKGEKK